MEKAAPWFSTNLNTSCRTTTASLRGFYISPASPLLPSIVRDDPDSFPGWCKESQRIFSGSF